MRRILSHAAANLDSDLSLRALAAQSKLSPFHFQRVFARELGETPKQFTLRLRLTRAALLLVTRKDSILDVALSCGFQSHEPFCRAFRRRFGMAPQNYRRRGFVQRLSLSQARDHAVAVNATTHCLRLYHIQTIPAERRNMSYTISKKELAPQPVLSMRRRVKRADIASTIAEVLPQISGYAQREAIAFAGPPFTRYIEMGPGLVTMEPGLPVAGGIDPKRIESGQAGVLPDTLPGGMAATTVHAGPYESLPDAYAAIQQWMEAEGLTSGGAPWESYVTDPADYPDPKDWKTEVYWPLSA